jgi:excisionase family DNA binding protein
MSTQSSASSPLPDQLASEPLSTLQDAAEYLKVSEDTVHRWIDRKRMPAHRISRFWRFKLSEIDTWVRSGSASRRSGK